MSRLVESLRWTFEGAEGAAGRVVLSSILAGGICGGGLLIGTLAMIGRGSPGLHLLLAPVLFLAGSLAGLVHGMTLTVLARPGDVPRSDACLRGLVAAVASVPLLPLSWLVSSSITLATALQVEQRTSWLIVSVGGAVLGVVVCGFAAVEGWKAVTDAVRRYTAE